MVAILGYSREQIVAVVKDMYTAVAEAPGQPFHFPVGREAARVLGLAPGEGGRRSSAAAGSGL